MTARGIAIALALVAIAGCSQAPREKPAQNANERLADRVMAAILRSDMRPVVDDFVPERKPDLLSPTHVKTVRDYVAGAGDFLGAREIVSAKRRRSTTHYFVASFTNGDVALQIFENDAGKIVHYHLGGAQSTP